MPRYSPLWMWRRLPDHRCYACVLWAPVTSHRKWLAFDLRVLHGSTRGFRVRVLIQASNRWLRRSIYSNFTQFIKILGILPLSWTATLILLSVLLPYSPDGGRPLWGLFSGISPPDFLIISRCRAVNRSRYKMQINHKENNKIPKFFTLKS